MTSTGVKKWEGAVVARRAKITRATMRTSTMTAPNTAVCGESRKALTSPTTAMMPATASAYFMAGTARMDSLRILLICLITNSGGIAFRLRSSEEREWQSVGRGQVAILRAKAEN